MCVRINGIFVIILKNKKYNFKFSRYYAVKVKNVLEEMLIIIKYSKYVYILM